MSQPNDVSKLTEEEIASLTVNPIALVELAMMYQNSEPLNDIERKWNAERVKSLKERAAEIAAQEPEKYTTEMLRFLGVVRKAKVLTLKDVEGYYVLYDKNGQSSNPNLWTALAAFKNQETARELSRAKCVVGTDRNMYQHARLVSRVSLIRLGGKLYRINVNPFVAPINPKLIRTGDGTYDIVDRKEDQLHYEPNNGGGLCQR